jgi:hypothetical protein
MLKIRQQVARPCEKKGIDNYLPSLACECFKDCDKLKGFLKPDSVGTTNHKNTLDTAFNGCQELENLLVKELLIRYESREAGGLEVILEGIESIQNLNAEVFNEDHFDGEDQLNPAGMASFYLDTVGNRVTDETQNDKQLPGHFTDESLISYFPETLGYAQSSSNAMSATGPKNLHDSFFLSLYVLGEFDKDSDDLQNLATCFLHGVDDEAEMKKIWPRYTDSRFKKYKSVIFARVAKKMPWWAKRFDKIWTKLSDAQIDALTLEWFHDSDEKPSQLENATQLGISVASYQERLHWAYKKIEELYPELERIKRRKTKVAPTKSALPLYLIDSNGEKQEIPLLVKKEKKLSSKQKMLIRRRAREITNAKFYLPLDFE